jgi:hypothetical protein
MSDAGARRHPAANAIRARLTVSRLEPLTKVRPPTGIPRTFPFHLAAAFDVLQSPPETPMFSITL